MTILLHLVLAEQVVRITYQIPYVVRTHIFYMASDSWHPNRRTVIGTTASSVALALAGCAGDSGNGDGTSEDTESQPDNGEPTDFPDGEECAVCNMVTPDHPEWNAQLVKEGGNTSVLLFVGLYVSLHG